MRNLKVTEWISIFIREQVQEGDLCIDATAGRGNDTLLLSSLAGTAGRVLSFDIQEEALSAAREKLKRAQALPNVELILDSHSHLERYASFGTVSCIMFNLGYLPSGDHSIATKAETTLPALESSLRLLKKGGLLSVCIYSGGDSGFEERDQVLSWLKGLDPKKYLVIRSDYYNRENDPPIPVLVIRL